MKYKRKDYASHLQALQKMRSNVGSIFLRFASLHNLDFEIVENGSIVVAHPVDPEYRPSVGKLVLDLAAGLAIFEDSPHDSYDALALHNALDNKGISNRYDAKARTTSLDIALAGTHLSMAWRSMRSGQHAPPRDVPHSP